MGCTAFHGSHIDWEKFFVEPKPDMWHVELDVALRSPGFVDFTFNIRKGQLIAANRTITFYGEHPDLIQSFMDAIARVNVRGGHYNDTWWQIRGDVNHPDHRTLPVFLSISHLPDFVQDAIKQAITGNHFKLLTNEPISQG